MELVHLACEDEGLACAFIYDPTFVYAINEENSYARMYWLDEVSQIHLINPTNSAGQPVTTMQLPA